MTFATYVRVAMLAIARNRMRAFLTTLGILIGVGAVITMIAIGEGSQAKVQSLISNLGTNALFIIPGESTKGGLRQYSSISTLTIGDAKAIGKECADVAEVSPYNQSMELTTYENQNWTTQVQGVSPSYFTIRNRQVLRGVAFTEAEVTASAQVAVLGQTVVTNLFGDEDPIGKNIRIKHTPFKVIGVLAPIGESLFGQDQDDVVMIPYTTQMHRITGNTYLRNIMAGATSKDTIAQAQSEITALLEQRHHISPWQPDDFFIRSPGEMLQTLNETAKVMELLLGAAAGISLLVGGIGIMNIMLVSVTERTREIGIRMAVGAADSDILLQFLIEAMVLSFLGGIFGLFLGMFGSFMVSKFMQVPFMVTLNSILLAIGFSAMVGIFFGYYPAQKASRMDPIEALRFQ